MSLHDEITRWSRNIQTTSYAMSIGELSSLYVDHELDLQPHLQRFFRWNTYQQTRLIESILLGIPLPPIFIYQTENWRWEVIDGVQRLSTIFQFMGLLDDEHGKRIDPLYLEKAEYLPSLQGKMWRDWDKEDDDDEREDDEHYLTMAQRLAIRRTKLDIIILREHGEWEARYELFYRLNRGGTILSDQEVRNFLVAMIDSTFLEFMKDLASLPQFQQCIAIPHAAFSAQFDTELVTKFLVYRHCLLDEIKEANKIGKFLTNKIMEFSENSPFDKEEERDIFEKTCNLLLGCLHQQAFVEFNPQTARFTGRFSVAAYEAIIVGLASHIAWWGAEQHERLIATVKSLWSNQRFLTQAMLPIQERTPEMVAEAIEIGRTLFDQAEHASEQPSQKTEEPQESNNT